MRLTMRSRSRWHPSRPCRAMRSSSVPLNSQVSNGLHRRRRRMKFRILAVLTFTFVSVIGLAQAPDLAPPPELKKLDWYIGEWSGKVKWSMMGMPPTEEETSFKNEWEGQFLKSTSVMTMSGMKMTEVSFIGWNPKTKAYDAYIFT